MKKVIYWILIILSGLGLMAGIADLDGETILGGMFMVFVVGSALYDLTKYEKLLKRYKYMKDTYDF
jgi:hypothetical protein